jgi:hypothetical protein
VTRARIARTMASMAAAVLLQGAALAADSPQEGSVGVPVAVAAATATSTTGSGTDPLLSGFVEVEKVRLVLLPTKVEDKHGRIIQGLTTRDFQLLEDHIPQTIQFVSVETNAPASIAFMLDVSGSMRVSGKLEAAKEAIRYFVDNLRPQDRFALIAFADEQVAWITEFTSDRATFLDRLAVQTGYGQTALNDAVAAAPGLVQAGTDGRKAIVLITDGVDNASRTSLDRAILPLSRPSVSEAGAGDQLQRARQVLRRDGWLALRRPRPGRAQRGGGPDRPGAPLPVPDRLFAYPDTLERGLSPDSARDSQEPLPGPHPERILRDALRSWSSGPRPGSRRSSRPLHADRSGDRVFDTATQYSRPNQAKRSLSRPFLHAHLMQ